MVPPPVGNGKETARSGTICTDPLPPTRRNAVRPSLVSGSTPKRFWVSTGSNVSSTPWVNSFSVPPRWLVVPACSPTQSKPPASANPWGRFPTAIVRATAPVTGSIHETVPAYWLATHTAPRPTVIAPAPSPTAIVAATVLVVGSIRDTVPSRLLATHTDPKPTTIAVGPVPTLIVAVTWSACGSTRTTRSPASSLTHSPPAPAATSVAPAPRARSCRSHRR